VAAMDCDLHWQEMAPLQGRKAWLAVEQRLCRSLACTASRNMTGSRGFTLRKSGSPASIVERTELEGRSEVPGCNRR